MDSDSYDILLVGLCMENMRRIKQKFGRNGLKFINLNMILKETYDIITIWRMKSLFVVYKL